MLKILIAVDGSEHSNRAIEAVEKMARSSPGLEAILVCVRTGAILEPLFSGDYTVATVQKLDADQENQQATVLNSAMDHAKAQGLKISESVRTYGVIANEIVRIAKERQVDQIAMGTRGMGAVGSLLLGSVAQRVLHQSDVPVLLVK
ncbi:universal stress protein [Polaromonas sp. UBA4122]|uniref:universal stress protein n=1 Tax=Polaromonas sp. UBA4122 TaxID=1947074 RepID=UPI0025F9248D|nr:universal stress protein [Polaromonas sp. UBA4122]